MYTADRTGADAFARAAGAAVGTGAERDGGVRRCAVGAARCGVAAPAAPAAPRPLLSASEFLRRDSGQGQETTPWSAMRGG